MDKVWLKVEKRLDQKMLQKETFLWKRIGVAAILLLMLSLGYQFFNFNPKPKNKIQNSIVVTDTLEKKMYGKEITNVNEINSRQTPILKKNVSKIINKKTENINETIALNEATLNENRNISNSFYNTATINESSHWLKGRVFEADGVYKTTNEPINDEAKEKKQAPLIIIDGYVSKEELEQLDKNEIDSIIELKEPLYIINETYHTEEELFGDTPTSPYAPLNQQEIETCIIIPKEKAVAIYGEKGKNGVVIITTKKGLPLSPKKQ